MLTIYYDNQKAIVANEQTKTYKVMPKSAAIADIVDCSYVRGIKRRKK